MSEKDLARSVMKYLKTINHLHAIRIEPSPYGGMRGVSDILCCYNGAFIAIELKAGKNTTTALQKRFLDKISRAGGVVSVCWTVNEVKDVVRSTKA